MTRKFFGTDGIRGTTNSEPMTAETALRVGQAAGAHFLRGDHRHRVVIGKDTRLSGYMMESAMVAGFTSVGMDVVLLGPMPTPAVAMLTRSMRADLGVMISASHNPFADNGIKLFGPDGYKLSDEAERAIERRLEKGQMVDGDQLMALIALGMQGRGELTGDAVVATVMSNLGLERRLKEAGLNLVRTKVGDRYVLEEMRKSGCNVGGEQSGHIILTDHATTGDGLVAGLQVLAALVEAKAPASELLRQFEPLPQLLKNVRFNGGAEPLEADSVRKRIAAAEAELEGRGRLVIRKSGTEPLIRVMPEGDDPELVQRLVDDICEAVQSAA